LLIEERRWTECVPAFLQLLELSEDQEVRGAIHKRIAEVFHYFLEDPEKAILHYEQATVLGGDVDDVPLRLLHLYIARKHWEKAQIVAEILATQAPPGSALAITYQLVLGDVLSDGLGQLEEAQLIYEAAAEAAPENVDAVERLGRMHALKGNIEGMLSSYELFLHRVPEQELSTRAEVLIRCADQLTELCQAPAEAQTILERVVSFHPNDVRVHQRLASLFASALGNPLRELQHLRKLVDLRAFGHLQLERIAQLYQSLGNELGQDTVASVLNFVRGIDTPLPTSSRLGPMSLDGEVYQQFVLHPYVRGATGRLFEALYELDLAQAWEADASTEFEDISQQTRLPAVALFNELSRAMGLSPRRIGVQRLPSSSIKILPGNPITLVLNADTLSSLIGHELRFYLARALELTRPRFLLASALSPFELLTVLRTLLGEVSKRRTPSAKPSLIERRAQDRVRSFLSRLRNQQSIERQAKLESLVEEVLIEHGEQAPSAKRYVAAARATAIRVALLASQNQLASLKRLLKEAQGTAIWRPKSFEEFLELVAGSPDLHAWLSFVVSQEYLEAQSIIGKTTGREPFSVSAESLEAWNSDALTRKLSPTTSDPVLDGLEAFTLDALSLAPEGEAAQRRAEFTDASRRTPVNDHPFQRTSSRLYPLPSAAEVDIQSWKAFAAEPTRASKTANLRVDSAASSDNPGPRQDDKRPAPSLHELAAELPNHDNEHAESTASGSFSRSAERSSAELTSATAAPPSPQPSAATLAADPQWNALFELAELSGSEGSRSLSGTDLSTATIPSECREDACPSLAFDCVQAPEAVAAPQPHAQQTDDELDEHVELEAPAPNDPVLSNDGDEIPSLDADVVDAIELLDEEELESLESSDALLAEEAAPPVTAPPPLPPLEHPMELSTVDGLELLSEEAPPPPPTAAKPPSLPRAQLPPSPPPKSKP
jgi:tetratricopeptide (TPR) repeat protein